MSSNVSGGSAADCGASSTVAPQPSPSGNDAGDNQLTSQEEQQQNRKEESENKNDNPDGGNNCVSEGKPAGIPPLPVYTEEELAREIICTTSGGTPVRVRWVHMMQCGVFRGFWTNTQSSETDEYVFPVSEVEHDVFVRVNEWLESRFGIPDPEVIIEDKMTSDRKHLEYGDFEKQFFASFPEDCYELRGIYLAANYLDIRSLYLYCAQEFADRIVGKKPEQVREMLALEDDLSEEEKKTISEERQKLIREEGAEDKSKERASEEKQPTSSKNDDNNCNRGDGNNPQHSGGTTGQSDGANKSEQEQQSSGNAEGGQEQQEGQITDGMNQLNTLEGDSSSSV